MAQFLPTQILSNIPSYSGTDSCKDWVKSFDERCEHFGYNEHWKLTNMDKFMEGTAKDWWSFSKQRFMEGLSRHNAPARYLGFVEAIKTDYPELDEKKQAKKDNATLKFTPGTDNAKEYVFKKKALCFKIDPNMTLKEQLEHLYEGLTPEVRWAVKKQLGAQGTVVQFLKELKCFSKELAKLSSKGDQVEQNPSTELFKFPLATSASTNSNSLNTLESQVQGQTERFLGSLPQELLNKPALVCGYCGMTGHLLVGCELHTKHFMPRFQNRNNDSGSFRNDNNYRSHNEKPYDRNNNSGRQNTGNFGKGNQGNGKA